MSSSPAVSHSVQCFIYIYFDIKITTLMSAGDVPRVDGQLAVARAFGDKSLKKHLSSEPDVSVEFIENDTEFVILASDGLWKVCFVIISGQATSYSCLLLFDSTKHITSDCFI